MAEQNWDLLFEAYREDELSPEEKRAFEARLRQDQAFSDAFQWHKEVLQQVWLAGYLQEAESLSTTPPPLSALPLYQRTWFRVASVVLIFGILLAFFYKPSPMSSRALAAAWVEDEPVSKFPSYLGLNDSIPQASPLRLKQQAREAYLAGQYAQVIALLNEFFTQADSEKNLYLFLGIAHLKQSDYPSAISAFQRVPTQGIAADDAAWYLALSYLLAGQSVEAQALLQKIAANEIQPHQVRAQQLLDLGAK